MKYIFLTLSLFALLFNAAVAEAAAYNCAEPTAEVKIEQTPEKTPCHSEAQTQEKTAQNSCCGELCLCLAKATLKTIGTHTPAFAFQKGVRPAAMGVMAANIAAHISAENPPPKALV